MFEFPTEDILGAGKMILVQAGMGAWVSDDVLAGTAAGENIIGIVSAIGAQFTVSQLINREVDQREAVKIAIERARRISGDSGLLGVNGMAMTHSYPDSMRGADDAGSRIYIVGAGLPLDLPELVVRSGGALVPIVSSARALKIIIKQWWDKYKRLPDAVVVEGPLAGGHLGFKLDDILKDEYQLEAIFKDVLAIANEYGFPVIVAGGIWDHADIVRWYKLGAGGVQLGTRFLATWECAASQAFKIAATTTEAENIIVTHWQGRPPGSPSKMTFRLLADSPGYIRAKNGERPISCRWKCMEHKGACLARDNPECAFCICNALLSAVNFNSDPNELPIYTVGANAWRFKKEKKGIISVRALLKELTTGIIAA